MFLPQIRTTVCDNCIHYLDFCFSRSAVILTLRRFLQSFTASYTCILPARITHHDSATGHPKYSIKWPFCLVAKTISLFSLFNLSEHKHLSVCGNLIPSSGNHLPNTAKLRCFQGTDKPSIGHEIRDQSQTNILCSRCHCPSHNRSIIGTNVSNISLHGYIGLWSQAVA